MAYCGLQDARRQLTVEAGRTTDNDLMAQFIQEATGIIQDYCGQPFEEQVETFAFNGEVGSQNPTLSLNERPLISITTLTNGDGSTVSGSAFELLPKGSQYPKKSIRLLPGNAWLPPFSNPANFPTFNAPYGVLVNRNYAVDAIQVTGLWAFNRRGPAAWYPTGLTLNGAIAPGATQITISAAPTFKFDIGALLRIENEYFQVVGPIASSTQVGGLSATTLDVIPAANGTTAAAHGNGVSIDRYLVEPTVVRACAIAAAWLYEGRLNPSGPQMTAPGFGSVDISLRLSPRAAQLLGYPFYNKWYGQA